MTSRSGGEWRLRRIIVAVLLLSASQAMATDESPAAVQSAAASEPVPTLQAALERRLWSAFAERNAEPVAPLVESETQAAPSLAERLWSTSDPMRPGSRHDPRWLRARDLLRADRAYSAALLLMQIEASADAAPDTAALLAQALYVYGTPSLAAAALARSRGADIELQGEALLAAARWQWREGQVDGTLAALADVPTLKVSAALKRQAALLRGLAEQKRGNPAAAIKAWSDAQVDPQRLLGASSEDRFQAGVAQYNLAVALLSQGRRQQGQQLLDRLGTVAAPDALNRALRDQANLALGWHFLREAQGATARPIFERVSLEGPQSSGALLGLGWAALAPQGQPQRREAAATGVIEDRETPKFVLKTMQRRGMLDCHEYNQRSRAPTELCSPLPAFGQADVPDEAARLLAKALLPWRTLRERDPQDAAVRESWTALPHALARLGLRSEAAGLYDDALVKLDQALAINAQARADVERGDWPTSLVADPSSITEPGAMSDAVGSIQQGLASLTRDGRFDSQMATIRRLQWLIAGSGAADPVMESLLQKQLGLFRVALQTALDQERSRLLAYLAAAHAGLASLNDRESP